MGRNPGNSTQSFGILPTLEAWKATKNPIKDPYGSEACWVYAVRFLFYDRQKGSKIKSSGWMSVRPDFASWRLWGRSYLTLWASVCGWWLHLTVESSWGLKKAIHIKTLLGTSLVVKGYNSEIPLKRVQAWFLVRELRSHMPWSVSKN